MIIPLVPSAKSEHKQEGLQPFYIINSALALFNAMVQPASCSNNPHPCLTCVGVTSQRLSPNKFSLQDITQITCMQKSAAPYCKRLKCGTSALLLYQPATCNKIMEPAADIDTGKLPPWATLMQEVVLKDNLLHGTVSNFKKRNSWLSYTLWSYSKVNIITVYYYNQTFLVYKEGSSQDFVALWSNSW